MAGWGYTNPFAQQAAAAATEQAAGRAADATRGVFGAWGAGVGSNAAAAASSTPSAPAYGGAGVPNGGGGGDLAAREAALARREAELAQREAALGSSATAGGVIKNWPSCCPFLYHNIRTQIPASNRSMIRFVYLVELITIAAFFYNAIIILATLFAGLQRPGLQWWFLSLLALTMGIPLSWWLFYKSLFRAAQTDGATYAYIRSFLLIMLHLAWCVWMILGLDNLGEFSAGIFPMFRFFQMGGPKGTAFGVMSIINIALWGIAGLGCWVALGLAVASYRRGRAQGDTPQGDSGIQMQSAV